MLGIPERTERQAEQGERFSISTVGNAESFVYSKALFSVLRGEKFPDCRAQHWEEEMKERVS